MTSELVPIQVTDIPPKGADATIFHIHWDLDWEQQITFSFGYILKLQLLVCN